MTGATIGAAGRRNRHRSQLLTALMGLFIGTLGLATAQAQEPPKPAAAPAAAPAPAVGAPASASTDAMKLDLDIATLLTTDIMPTAEYEDAFWHIGGQLLRVPLIVSNVNKPEDLNASTLKVRNGRFICWKLADWADPASGLGVPPPALLIDGQQVDYPLTMKLLTAKPGGTFSWKIDKTLVGATLVPLNDVALKPYLLYLTSGSLQARQPRPVPPGELRALPNEKPGDTAARVRLLQDTYNAKLAEYKRLQALIKALPLEFEVPAPKRIWGMYVLSVSAKELGIEGSGIEPWNVKLDDFRALQRCTVTPITIAAPAPGAPAPAAGGIRVNTGFGADRLGAMASMLPQETQDQLNRMNNLIKDKHPYSYRAVAIALRGGKLVPLVPNNPADPLYALIKSVIICNDKIARDMLLEDLVKTQPPTVATTELLKSAAQFMTPELQAVMVRNAMQGPDAFNAAQQMLSDATGPSPNLVVHELAIVAANPARTDLANQMMRGFRLSDMTDARREKTIAAVIEVAGDSPPCASILNRQLLGAVDPKTIATTLEILASSETQGVALRPIINNLVANVFGKPINPGHVESSNRPKPIITKLIPIDSVTHNIFARLRSSDAHLRSLAWRSLDFFTLSPVVNPNESDPMESIIALAIDQNPTPPQVVDLVARQANPERSTRGLAKIVFSANGEASTRATRLLVGSNRPIYDVLQSLSFGEREGFASRVYMNLSPTGREPQVVALMRERSDTNPVVKWFAEQLAEGKLPDAAAWGANAGSEDRLLGLVSSADAKLATGAVAALINSIGGDDSQALALTEKLREGQDLTLPKLRSIWLPAKQKIFAQRVQKATGFYNLTFISTEIRTDFTPKGPVKRNVESKIPIGKVQLQSDGQTVKLVNQNIAMTLPDNVLSIRIANVAELKNFPNEQLAGMTLDTVKTPLDLILKGDGSWSGIISISDTRKLEMILTPQGE